MPRMRWLDVCWVGLLLALADVIYPPPVSMTGRLFIVGVWAATLLVTLAVRAALRLTD